ncbi:MAG: FAD-binding oxidoreductase [Candidatus Omnitrophica bacterium]|nr:FAD-binding oxidoreductase [Candidatus Omnitrophota bacterium]
MVVKDKREEFLSYLEDTSNLRGNADILYIPGTQEEVPEILRICAKNNIPVTCSGARTGTTGGCVPLEGALICLEKLNRIIDIDTRNKVAIVQAGLTLEELERETKKYRLSLRAQPTESLAYIGGAVSTSASGMRGFKYGGIRRYVRRLKVVLADGTVLNIKRGEIISRKRQFSFNLGKKRFDFNLPSYNMPLVKHQAGYFVKDNMDLIDLFIGSEGTLGVITELEICLQSLAEQIFDCIAFFEKEEYAFDFVRAVKKAKNKNVLMPVSLEFFDKNSLEFLRTVYPNLHSYAAAVYFEQEADSGSEVMDAWLNLIEGAKGNQNNTWFGDTEIERGKIYDFRHKLPQLINEFLRESGQRKVATDIAVPDNEFMTMYSFYQEIGEESGLSYVNFGHIGEDHLHFNFLPRNETEYLKAKSYIEKLIKKAISLKGTVSAEHGIGKLKKEYLELMYGKEHITEMIRLKKYFDPYFFLGRGNIFDFDG